MAPRTRARSVLVGIALTAGTLVAAAGSTSVAAQTTDPPSTPETVVLASGVDGVGLRAIDNSSGWDDTGRRGREIPVVAVEPLFEPPRNDKEIYTREIEGARWITDRFTDDGSTQMRASELAAPNRLRGAATPLPLPEVPIRSGNIVDYGEEWLSTRTFLHTWQAPAGRSVTSARLEFAADNNVAISVVNGGRTTELVAASCGSWLTCGTAAGESNFREVHSIENIPAGTFGAGDNEFRFRVQDWGTVVGLTFKITIVLGPPTAPPICDSDPEISCSLTAARVPGLPEGQLRYCYKSPDGITRSFWVEDGGLPYTLESGTWTDAPAPPSGSVRYPESDSAPIPLAKIIDPQLRNCPGALTS